MTNYPHYLKPCCDELMLVCEIKIKISVNFFPFVELNMTFRITLLLPILSFAYNCTLWRCSDHPLEDNQCINSTIVDNSYQVFDLSICPDDMFCEAPSFHTDNKCQALPTILGTRYDNEECTIDLDCAASEYTKPTCTNGRCTGYLKQGETCGNTLDCSVGLWCDWINGRICNK